MAEALDEVSRPPIHVQPQLLKSCLKLTDAEQESNSWSLVMAICNSFFCHKPLLSYPNIYILNCLQITCYEQRDPLHFQNFISNPPIYQASTSLTNYSMKLQYHCSLNKPWPDDTGFCWMQPWTNFYMRLPLNSKMTNERTGWIPVNCLQLYFNPQT